MHFASTRKANYTYLRSAIAFSNRLRMKPKALSGRSLVGHNRDIVFLFLTYLASLNVYYNSCRGTALKSFYINNLDA